MGKGKEITYWIMNMTSKTETEPQFSPEEIQQLKKLITLLQLGGGGVILIECENILLRKYLFEFLEKNAKEKKFYLYPLEITQPSIVNELKVIINSTQLQQLAAKYSNLAFLIYGSEIFNRIELKSFIGYLNHMREAFREFDYPIIFIFTPHLLKQVARGAPDFWSWRSEVFHFRSRLPHLRSVFIDINPLGDFLPSKENEIHLYKRLAEQIEHKYKNQPVLIASIKVDLAEALANTSPDKSLQLLHEAIALLKKDTLNNLLTRIYYRMACMCYRLYIWKEAIKYLEKMLILEEQKGNPHKQAFALCALAKVQLHIGDIEKANSNFQKALGLYAQLQHHTGTARAIEGLGCVQIAMNNPIEAIQNFKESLRLYELGKWKEGCARSNFYLGEAYVQDGDLQEALISFENAHNLWTKEEENEKVEKTEKEEKLTAALFKIGKINLTLGDWKEARDKFIEILHRSKHNNNNKLFAAAMNELGCTHFYQYQYKEAISMLINALKLAREEEDWYNVAIILYNLGFMYRAQGLYTPAIKLLEESLDTDRELENNRSANETLALLGKTYQHRVISRDNQ